MNTTFALIFILTSATSTNESPYEIDPVTDGLITGGGFLFLTMLDGIAKNSLKPTPSCTITDAGICDPNDLRAFDASIVGNDSKAWRTISDVGLYGSLALPLIAGGLDYGLASGSGRLSAFGTDTLVMTEAAVLTTLVTSLFKYAVRRPRPTQYSTVTQETFGRPDHQLSFPSGHTSVTAAATTAYAATFGYRYPNSPWKWAVYSGAALLTGITGYARTAGGKHFYSDIIAGAALGVTLGILVPYLHRSRDIDAHLVSLGSSESPITRGITITLPI